MTVQFYSSGKHIQNINGKTVKNEKYNLAFNPNNKENVHLSITSDGLTNEKTYDSLGAFFHEIKKSENGLISTMENDLIQLKSIPAMLYIKPHKKLRKKLDKKPDTYKKSDTYKKPQKKITFKKPKKRKSLRNK